MRRHPRLSHNCYCLIHASAHGAHVALTRARELRRVGLTNFRYFGSCQAGKGGSYNEGGGTRESGSCEEWHLQTLVMRSALSMLA